MVKKSFTKEMTKETRKQVCKELGEAHSRHRKEQVEKLDGIVVGAFPE